MHKDEISRSMAKSGLTHSDPTWLQKYQWSVTEVIDRLGGHAKVLELYGDMAKGWNEAELPEELQRR